MTSCHAAIDAKQVKPLEPISMPAEASELIDKDLAMEWAGRSARALPAPSATLVIAVVCRRPMKDLKRCEKPVAAKKLDLPEATCLDAETTNPTDAMRPAAAAASPL
jgi:hypothetical protein